VPAITMMRDVADVENEYVPGEKSINKIQDFQNDPVMFNYCKDPNVSFLYFCEIL